MDLYCEDNSDFVLIHDGFRKLKLFDLTDLQNTKCLFEWKLPVFFSFQPTYSSDGCRFVRGRGININERGKICYIPGHESFDVLQWLLLIKLYQNEELNQKIVLHDEWQEIYDSFYYYKQKFEKLVTLD